MWKTWFQHNVLTQFPALCSVRQMLNCYPKQKAWGEFIPLPSFFPGIWKKSNQDGYECILTKYLHLFIAKQIFIPAKKTRQKSSHLLNHKGHKQHNDPIKIRSKTKTRGQAQEKHPVDGEKRGKTRDGCQAREIFNRYQARRNRILVPNLKASANEETLPTSFPLCVSTNQLLRKHFCFQEKRLFQFFQKQLFPQRILPRSRAEEIEHAQMSWVELERTRLQWNVLWSAQRGNIIRALCN